MRACPYTSYSINSVQSTNHITNGCLCLRIPKTIREATLRKGIGSGDENVPFIVLQNFQSEMSRALIIQAGEQNVILLSHVYFEEGKK